MPKRLQVYEAHEVAVTFDPSLCIHAEECVRGLPEVFDPRARRWIRPDRAPAERVTEVVERCPSGALRAFRHGLSDPPATPLAATIRVARDGPLYLRGRVRIENDQGELVAEADAAALCRCGATGNPPFCDGSHAQVGFRKE